MLYLPQHEPTQGQVLTSICSTSLSMTHPGSGINIYMLYLPQHEPTQGQVSTSICSTSLSMNPPSVNIYMLYLHHEPTQGQVLYLPQHEPTQGQVLTYICSTSLSMTHPGSPPSAWTHPGSGITSICSTSPQHEPSLMNPPSRYQHALPPSTWTHPGSGVYSSTSLSMTHPGSGINIYMLYLPQHEHTQCQVPPSTQVLTSICSISLSMKSPRVRYPHPCSTSLNMNTPRVRY